MLLGKISFLFEWKILLLSHSDNFPVFQNVEISSFFVPFFFGFVRIFSGRLFAESWE